MVCRNALNQHDATWMSWELVNTKYYYKSASVVLDGGDGGVCF